MTAHSATVRWIEIDAVRDGDWPRLEALLSEAERARAGQFHFARDRKSYIAAHALARAMLSRQAGGEPASWRFETGIHGKPEAVMPSGTARLRLNLSHTHGLAAAALAQDHDIGIDVERLDRKARIADLAERYFAPAEKQLLAQTPPQRAHETFLTLWTLKEAYVKATGSGLAKALDSFAFTLNPPAIAFDAPRAAESSAWYFHHRQVTENHILALAMHHPNPQRVRLDASSIEAGGLWP